MDNCQNLSGKSENCSKSIKQSFNSSCKRSNNYLSNEPSRVWNERFITEIRTGFCVFWRGVIPNFYTEVYLEIDWRMGYRSPQGRSQDFYYIYHSIAVEKLKHKIRFDCLTRRERNQKKSSSVPSGDIFRIFAGILQRVLRMIFARRLERRGW